MIANQITQEFFKVAWIQKFLPDLKLFMTEFVSGAIINLKTLGFCRHNWSASSSINIPDSEYYRRI